MVTMLEFLKENVENFVSAMLRGGEENQVMVLLPLFHSLLFSMFFLYFNCLVVLLSKPINLLL